MPHAAQLLGRCSKSTIVNTGSRPYFVIVFWAFIAHISILSFEIENIYPHLLKATRIIVANLVPLT